MQGNKWLVFCRQNQQRSFFSGILIRESPGYAISYSLVKSYYNLSDLYYKQGLNLHESKRNLRRALNILTDIPDDQSGLLKDCRELEEKLGNIYDS